MEVESLFEISSKYPFLESLQENSSVKIPILPGYASYLKITTTRNILTIKGILYKNYAPFTIPSWIYESIISHTSSQTSQSKNISIRPNRQFSLHFEYTCQSQNQPDMIKQHYQTLLSELKNAIKIILNYLQHPEYMNQQRLRCLQKLQIMVNESTKYSLLQFTPNDVNKSMEQYFLLVEDQRKNKLEGTLQKGYLIEKQIFDYKRTLEIIDTTKIPVIQQGFRLKQVIEVNQQRFEDLSRNLLWKLKVLKNLAVYIRNNEPEKFFFTKENILVDAQGRVTIDKHDKINQKKSDNGCQLEDYYLIFKKEKNSEAQKRIRVIYLGVIMYQLLFGQVPTQPHPSKIGNSDVMIVVSPALSLLEEIKQSKIHQVLMLLTMKCIQGNNTSYLKDICQSVPHLDWVIVILTKIIHVFQPKQ